MWLRGRAPLSSPGGGEKVTITQLDDRFRVLLGDELFAEYLVRGFSRPIVYPILGPHGIGMTRNFPIEDGVAGESHDHPHQKSLFFAYGSVNGVNFFAEYPESGKTVHDKLLKLESGANRGVVQTLNKWVTAGGDVALHRQRALLPSTLSTAFAPSTGGSRSTPRTAM